MKIIREKEDLDCTLEEFERRSSRDCGGSNFLNKLLAKHLGIYHIENITYKELYVYDDGDVRLSLNSNQNILDLLNDFGNIEISGIKNYDVNSKKGGIFHEYIMSKIEPKKKWSYDILGAK